MCNMEHYLHSNHAAHPSTAFAQRPRVWFLETSLQLGEHRLDQWLRGLLQTFENLRVGESVLQALEVEARAVDAQGSGALVFIVENCPGKKLGEAGNVSMGDVILKLLDMLSPWRGPKLFQEASGYGRKGIPLVPVEKGFLQHLPDFLLGRKDLVLQRSSGNWSEWRWVECQGVAVEVEVCRSRTGCWCRMMWVENGTDAGRRFTVSPSGGIILVVA